ncbi:MAG: MFS transporter, partial [Burkholderiaceae bacterium]|nr:MFS transporter [Burkholderiaceae bacterium]
QQGVSVLAQLGWAQAQTQALAPQRDEEWQRQQLRCHGGAQLWGVIFNAPHRRYFAAGAHHVCVIFDAAGLWLGPLLMERHGYSLVASGNVAMVLSLVSLFTPVVYGRLDPGPGRRRAWLMGYTLLLAAVFATIGLAHAAWLNVACCFAVGLLTGYMVLQYSDVRSAYPAAMTGRAMAVFTMAMFLGVALMQWLTGLMATLAAAHGADPYVAVMLTIAGMLACGAVAFKLLPSPPRTA